MARIGVVVLVCLAARANARAQELVPDKALELELKANDPVLEGRGPSRTFEYDVTIDGTLHVWAASKDFDPILRITNSDGELLAEDDNSGGGTTAYIALAVTRNELPSILVASKTPITSGKLVVHVSGAPESDASDLTIERALIDASNSARSKGDYITARANAAEAVTKLLARPAAEQGTGWFALLNSAGLAAGDAQDARSASAAWSKVLEVRSRTLPDEHPDLQAAREHLAGTLYALRDLAGARALDEKVLEVRSRTLPDEHPHLQAARGNLAVTIKALGDLAGSRALSEKVVESFSRTLPDEHRDLQTARGNLASTIREQGDLAGARALEEKVLEISSRTLPDEHPDLQRARENLALTLSAQGDLAGARALEEKVLEINSRTLPDEHPDLQGALQNLAATLYTLGDLAGARALQEKVLEINSRTLPDEHPDLQVARQNMAVTIQALGDVAGARALEEKVLEIRSRTLPDEHPDLQAARQNLAATIKALGDFAGARALEEKVLEVNSRTLSGEDPRLQAARGNLAITIIELGDLAGARALFEKVLEIRSRTLPDEHPDLQTARQNLAGTLYTLGDMAGARALFEKVLEVNSRTLPDEHRDVQIARENLAATLASELARERRSLGSEGGGAIERQGGTERCAELIGAACRAQLRAARAAILESPGREAEERCSSLAHTFDVSLSFAQGYGVFEPLRALESPAFALAETTRGAAIASAGLARRAANAPKYSELRDALLEASDALAGLARQGTTSEEFDRARVKREAIERELVALAHDLSGGNESGLEFDLESLALRLGERQAAVAFRRYTKWREEVVDELDATGQPTARETAVESLCAFVLRRAQAGSKNDPALASKLMLVDLGPIGPIEESVRTWRDDLSAGSDSRGVLAGARSEPKPSAGSQEVTLRKAIFDPLLPSLGGAERIVVALDDVLNLVPLDALPFDESSLVGDHWHIETRTTLIELLQTPDPLGNSGQLVTFGDIAYGAEVAPLEPNGTSLLAKAALDPRTADSDPRTAEHAGILRGGAWSGGFSALPGTGIEVRGIARCFRDRFGANAGLELSEHSSATRERLIALAPKSRWLHIATHGWFAPESIKSWSDPEPLDKQSGLGKRMSGEEQVRGMSPMLLCGLALAGANLPENEVGRAPGLITAEELSTLDLSNCELVVLSACDTNVGERRAGQGVHSLQMALQMAGARSVITSLWKVPDEATKELMLDFYRRLWVEKKPKAQALWEAKLKLRNAKDERGQPLYATRDWAAWVLTGEPD